MEFHLTPEVNIHDIWDLMPFDKFNPTLNKISTKLGINTPKIIGINKDILEPLGGVSH